MDADASDEEMQMEEALSPPGSPAADRDCDRDCDRDRDFSSRRAAAATMAAGMQLVPVGSKRPANEVNHMRPRASAPKKPDAAEGGVKKLRAPPAGLDCDESGKAALLQTTERADADELYTDQEKALSEYLKLHPMLSLRVYAHSNPQPPLPPRAP
jgi:hypothetical protein